MSAIKIIQAFAKKALTKNQGSGITTLPSKFMAESKAGEIAATLQQAGIPINQLDDYIRSETDLLKFLNIIESTSKPRIIPGSSAEGQDMTKKLMSFLDRQSGDNVVDITGKTIDTSQGIMGGKSVKELMDSGQVTKGARGMKKNDKVLKRDLFKNSNLNETDDAIKTRLEAGNKKSVKKMGDKREMTADEIEDFEMEMGDLDPYDFDGTIGSANKIRKEAKDYEAYMYNQYKMGKLDPSPGDGTPARKRFLQKRSEEAEMSGDKRLMTEDEVAELMDLEDIPDYAKGGRAGYYMGGQAMVGEDLSEIGHGSDSLMARNMQLAPNGQATTSTGLNYLLGQDNDTVRVPYAGGGMGKRAFLKFLASGAAGIAGLKTGLFGVGKKEVAKEVVKEAATSGGVPPYFFKLVNKIKNLGDDITETGALADRQKVKRYKDYELTEDVSTGRIEIQRYKQSDEASYYGQPLTEETYMAYTPGENIIGKGKKPIKTQAEYEEGTAFVRNDRGYTGEVVEESTTISDDIFREVGEELPEAVRKTKAGDIINKAKPGEMAEGGRIGYSGGGILKAIIAKSAASKGLSVRDFIKATSYKGLSPEVKMYISAKDFAALKGGQKEMYDNFIDMAKTRKSFQENVEGGKGTPVEPLFKNLEKTMDEQSFVPKTVTADDIAEMELMVRNRFEKNRKLNATGGLATMLGE